MILDNELLVFKMTCFLFMAEVMVNKHNPNILYHIGR